VKNAVKMQKIAKNAKKLKNKCNFTTFLANLLQKYIEKESRNFCHPSLVDFGPSPK
jgi:hypothetical protein